MVVVDEIESDVESRRGSGGGEDVVGNDEKDKSKKSAVPVNPSCDDNVGLPGNCIGGSHSFNENANNILNAAFQIPSIVQVPVQTIQPTVLPIPVVLPTQVNPAIIGDLLLSSALLQSAFQQTRAATTTMQQQQHQTTQKFHLLHQQQQQHEQQAKSAAIVNGSTDATSAAMTRPSGLRAQVILPQLGVPEQTVQAVMSHQALLPPQQQAIYPVTHNLIPAHLQASAMSPSMNGSPGYQPALIPSGIPLPQQRQQQQQNAASDSGDDSTDNYPVLAALTPSPPILTVQDRPLVTPVYNGVNPNYPGLRVMNSNPPVFCVDNFLNPFECNFLIQVAQDSFGPAPVVGKGAGEISPSRTSSTCYLAREDLPDYLRKVALLTGKPVEHCELPQVGRYLPSQQYLQHFDAFDLSNKEGRRFAANGGQRTITVLVYLNDVPRGGATRFPALNLDVQPRQGTALVFFPSTIDGYLDKMALHAALPAIDTKYVSQVWIRQTNYSGQPSKRLPQTLGIPFGQEAAAVANPGLVATTTPLF